MRLIGDVEIHAFESIAGHLRPDAVLLHRDLVHFDIVDFELAGHLVHLPSGRRSASDARAQPHPSRKGLTGVFLATTSLPA